MFSVSFPDSCRKERCWIGAVVLREFLGLEYELRFEAQETARIEAEGKTLELADVFFKKADAGWLAPATLPARPLQQWCASNDGLDAELLQSSVPVMYGHAAFEMQEGRAYLGLDVFGSAFFMLSRYEEAVTPQRDRHDRFPAQASLAWQEGFLYRPIIDEYVEILWAAMQRLWPQAVRKRHEFKTVVSCDVDRPYHPGAKSFRRMTRAMAGKLVRTRDPIAMLDPCRNYFGALRGDFRNDPYYFTVDWMMDVNEKAANTVAFNFIPEITDPAYDGLCPITDPAVVAMLQRIGVRRHEIGIHPGYLTYQSTGNTVSGLNRIRHVLKHAGIEQQVAGGRIHYLRWSTKTPSVWNAAGLSYDSTLGYADHVGFRCGTCREYPMFDLHQREMLQLRQLPLICMDRAIFSYMGYGFTADALEQMNK